MYFGKSTYKLYKTLSQNKLVMDSSFVCQPFNSFHYSEFLTLGFSNAVYLLRSG